MADTAAFFAKKKKKKSFKFNANKIDASQVISTVHVDAPAVSSAVDNTVSTLKSMTVKDSKTPGETTTAADGTGGGGGDWDDTPITTKKSKPTTNSTIVVNTNTGGGGAAELLDMKALEKKRNEQDDIAERLRVEETKAKLAAARDGMEKEGQRLKEAKEAKTQPKSTGTSAGASAGGSRFGKASANMFGGGGGASAGASGDSAKGKWVPPHLRGGGGMAPRTMAPASSGFQRKVDTQDENLFPDLATADKIIAQEEEQRQHANRKAKAPTAAWGMKRPSAPSAQVVKQTTPPPLETNDDKLDTKEQTPVLVSKPLVKSTPSVPAASTLKKKTKKKKKDLSTFKAS